MTWAVACAAWACLAGGLVLALSRDLVRVVVGLALLGSGGNLLLFGVGRLGSTEPPIVTLGLDALPSSAANPVPQALVLTAIVIGFALTCFSLVLTLRVLDRSRTLDVEALRAVEPAVAEPHAPPVDPADGASAVDEATGVDEASDVDVTRREST